MTMSKHTPGPWVFYSSEPSIDPNWHHVTNASRMRVLANVHVEPGNATDLANIRLITAAPDLLAALLRVDARGLEEFPAGPDDPYAIAEMNPKALDMWRTVRAALAKVAGELPAPAPVADATQGALFPEPAPKPPSAIAEGR